MLKLLLITNNVITFVSAKVTFFKSVIFVEMSVDAVTCIRMLI